MREEAGAEANSAAGVGDSASWRVVEVRPLAGFRLSVRFADGTQGEVDLSALISGSRAGVFARLRDHSVFAQVGIDHGAVTWPGNIDLAPDAMYDAIKANGVWHVE
jgi:hypothetical protein